MQKKKILLADDDAEDIAILKDALSMLYPDDILLAAANGEQAWDILLQSFDASCTPCLVVLDLNMPKMNGAQTLGKIKSDDRFAAIPVIIYSTSINPLEKEKCLGLGAHAYIAKPISFNESIDTAKVFLEFCQPKSLA